jgi:hypothetical protein
MADTKVMKRSKYKTGFCSNRQCEGTRPRSPSGKPLKTCEFFLECPCECHQVLDEMAELTGRGRELRVNPEYVAPVSPYWMPTPEFLAALRRSNLSGGTGVPGTSEPAADGDSRPAMPVFTPTPTGIRARGQLEHEVKKVCDAWGGENASITISFLASEIDPDEPPSVGAIREVLLRWVKYGFATMGTEPLRFTGYTAEGAEKGLDVMKYNYERNRRSNKSKAERGYR